MRSGPAGDPDRSELSLQLDRLIMPATATLRSRRQSALQSRRTLNYLNVNDLAASLRASLDSH
jgi:hypothetical protein